MDEKNEIARNLHRLMGDLTQEELARKLGISQQSVSGWLNGKSKPRHGNLVKLAAVLACQPDDIDPHSDDLATFNRNVMLDPCPLSDCPMRGRPHAPLTQDMLCQWASMNRDQRLEVLTFIARVRSGDHVPPQR